MTVGPAGRHLVDAAFLCATWLRGARWMETQRGSKLLLGWWSLDANAEGCNDNSDNVLFPQITFWVYSLLVD